MFDTYNQLIDFQAQSDIRGARINLSWKWKTTDADAMLPPLRLVRSERAYPEKVDQGKSIVSLIEHNEGVSRYDNLDSGDTEWAIDIKDELVTPGKVYYYAIFVPYLSNPAVYYTKPQWRVSALATNHYDFATRLYQQLPAIHHNYDEPDPAQAGAGQLRRFMQVFGGGLDQIRSTAEGLKKRHDVLNVEASALPRLARWIGWEPDTNAPAMELRNDILQAPEIYKTAGTLRNLQSLVTRVTGWDCKIKEFGRNVLFSNAPEQIRLWEIWQTSLNTDLTETDLDKKPQPNAELVWNKPTDVTHTDAYHGSPRRVLHQEREWLIYHATDSGQRDIWFVPHNTKTDPYEARLFKEPVHTDSAEVINENPCAVTETNKSLRLFWCSNKGGHWNIWTHADDAPEPFRNVPTDDSEAGVINLSVHQADDRNPAAVTDLDGNIWVFWQSNRRGPCDIWYRKLVTHNNGNKLWEPKPYRIPRPQPDGEDADPFEYNHETPAVIVDNLNRIWLFYSELNGAGSELLLQIHDKGKWSKPFTLQTQKDEQKELLIHRNESPHAVFCLEKVWLFWHSNRNGHWQIYGQTIGWDNDKNSPDTKSKAFTITHEPDSGKEDKEPAYITESTSDKEPFAYIDDNKRLNVLWRSQRRGRQYLSCSLDENTPGIKNRLGSFEDCFHYSYDTGNTNKNFYSLGAVGIYLTPTTEQADKIDRSRKLIEGPLRKFLPIQVSPIVFVQPAIHRETIDPPKDFVAGQEIASTHTENYNGVDDGYRLDRIPEWIWLTSWYPGNENHHSVDFTTDPINTNYRILHSGIKTGV